MKLISSSQVLTELQKAQVLLGPSVRLLQDSRQLQPGDIFVAINGHEQDGAAYIYNALDAGAAAILVADNCNLELFESADVANVPIFIVTELHACLAEVCQAFYFSKQTLSMPLIGVTGTNGKTSINHLLAQLSSICLNQPLASIGTLGAGFINELQPLNNTTPGVTQVYQLLAEFQQQQDVAGLVMEVSSHALEQDRVKGLHYDIAIFTNLTHEHLDYHGSMSAYFAAKSKLFTEYSPANAVINIDDEYGVKLADLLNPETRLVVYGQSELVKSYLNFVHLESIESHQHGLSVKAQWRLDGTQEQGEFQLPIYGEFNAVNLAAVFASALLLDWPIQPVHFSQLRSVPGRLELFVKPDLPVAIVDYAHTPDALKQSLKSVCNHLKGRLWLVFGCGGDRDKSKRPLMAEIAESLADEIVITNDNPRTEVPEHIVRDIKKGFSKPDLHHVILDRKQAINYALGLAEPKDAVLIAGKGHETYQVIGKQAIDYDERKYVTDALKRLGEELGAVHHD